MPPQQAAGVAPRSSNPKRATSAAMIREHGDQDVRRGRPAQLEQLERCMRAGDAELGVLCADHHPGYSQPIGGGIAYEGYVLPSGGGYDIGCVASGARVTTADGHAVPIEHVVPQTQVVCLDADAVRPVAPNLGA